jgi:glycosyltransferase involved in cell wall biosynthesis
MLSSKISHLTQNLKFSIVLPAYNEEKAISQTLNALCKIPELLEAEIIVVDDGSTDGTASSAASFPRVKLVQHPVNKGYGAALVSGMMKATGEYIIWMDSDGQHRVEDLVSIMQTIEKYGPDYCIGVRNSNSYQETSRKLGKWILRNVVYLAAGRPVADFNSGLRGFKRSIILKYLHLLPKGFGASTTTTLVMLEQGYQGKEVPITVLPRVGSSTVKQFRDGMRTLTLILRIFLLFKPLHFFGSIGGVLSLSGLGYGLWSAFYEGQGFPVLGAVVFLAGLQTFFIGLLMDQISAMRRERFKDGATK